MTLSYVSISKPDWFPLQSAMQAPEHVLAYITSTYDGRTPPVTFLVHAWAATIHHISDRVRMSQRCAREVIGNVGPWEHKRKWSPAVSSNGGNRAVPAKEPDNKSLQNKLNSMKGQVEMSKRQAAAAERRSAAPERRRVYDDEDDRAPRNDGRRSKTFGSFGKDGGKGGMGGKGGGKSRNRGRRGF